MNTARQVFVHAGGPTEEALFEYLAGRLHPQAAQWIEAHVEGCARCAAAVARVRALHEALEPPKVDPFVQARALTELRRRLAKKPKRAVRPAFVLSTSLAFCAFAVLAWVGIQRLHPRGKTEVQVALGAPVPWTVIAREGAADVEVGDDHAVVQANLTLPTGSVLQVQPGARVTARWGAARVVVDGGRLGARVHIETSRTDDRKLKLDRGRVILDVDPLIAAASVAIITPDEQVTVHGTIFLVDAGADGTAVAVERGLVRVASTARTTDVRAGLQLAPRMAALAPLSDEAKRAFALLAGLLPGEPVTESLDVFADVANAEVSIDGVVRGHAPLSLAVAPGVHRVRVTAPGRLPVEERVEVVAGTPTLFRAELYELKATVESSQSSSVASPATSSSHVSKSAHAAAPAESGDVLAEARADVLQGNYARAITRLEAMRKQSLTPTQGARATLLLAQAHRLSLRPERAVPLLEKLAQGQGPEAEQGQFMLAQTLGRDLGDPRRATVVWADAQRRFPNGIFHEEVAYRLGESLLGAGDTREGIEALERYLKSFPGAAHGDDAHLLIAQARRDRLSDCAGAIPHLRAVAVGRGPRAELALIGQARCLSQIGRTDEARAAYARYLDEVPRGRFADEARAHASARADRKK